MLGYGKGPRFESSMGQPTVELGQPSSKWVWMNDLLFYILYNNMSYKDDDWATNKAKGNE